MSFWDEFKKSIKTYSSALSKVENDIRLTNMSLAKLYEDNRRLEEEIVERTKELDVANRQMLTLQHILNVMNSSKPLSGVLNTVVNNLQGEFGYLHSCIVKKRSEDEHYVQMLACDEELAKDIQRFFHCEPSDIKLKMIENIYDVATKGNGGYYSEDIVSFLSSTLEGLPLEIIEKEVKTSKVKSYMVIPLTNKNSCLGSLVVFSSRNEVTDSELNFLKLFARQIELAITIADLFQAVKEQAITDGMTGLYNRRYFEEFIKKEENRANRQHQGFTIVGLDLDHLKEINDKYGHNYGDIAIKAIAEVLKKSCRSVDIAARIGGEEFNVILPGIDSKGGFIVAERIRKSIAAVSIEKIGHITASLGVATYFEHSENVDELVELVDHAMYESKKAGRNRTTIAKTMEEISWKEVAIDTFINILEKHRIPLDTTTTSVLNEKLTNNNVQNDSIYQVSDMLISTYNPNHATGSTKQKIILATLLSKRFELPKEKVDKLKIAVLLYDIGNLLLPKELLQKKEPLTEDDKIFIKQHPLIATKKILEPISDIVDIIPIIEKHHENWDGSGYPCKLVGNEIPIESQIILIVDSYFALLEKRPYREAMSKEEALDVILKDVNLKWNEKLAQEFITIVKEDID